MKRIIPALFLLFALPVLAQSPSSTLKIFSRYNYYLDKQKGNVVCVLPEALNPKDYTLKLMVKGQPIAITTAYTQHTLSATMDSLTVGINTIDYQLSTTGKSYATGKVELIRRDAKANAVQLDLLTGGLIADGLPFFPFGFYCGPVSDLPEREVVHGFNMIGPYQDNLPASYSTRKAYMDRCAQLGIKVQYGVNSLVGSGHNGDKGLNKSQQVKLEILKNEVLAFKDHPALLSWYINDEPDGQGRPPAVLEEAYQLIRRLDPYHPVSIVFMMPSKAADFKNTMDIAMTDPYPIPGPADKVMEDVKKYADAYRYEKSVWLVPQAFGGQEMWPREPTAHELRLMTYMGLVSGAKGIQYYVHAAGNLNPQSVSAWSACSDMAVETAQMTPFLLSADDAPEIKASDPKILTRAFRYQGNLLIIAVNNENAPKAYSMEVGPTDNRLNNNAELWFEDRAVPFQNNAIKDIIDAYSTRVYLIRATENSGASKLNANNLTINPSFEKIVSPGLAIGANVTETNDQKADKGATFFTDPRESVDGMFSLRLISPTDSGGKKIRFLPLVMSKGNSYTVSIWAKAKLQDKMPSFKIAVNGMNQQHQFTLSTAWKKYSFTYQAESSTTTAIPTLELLQQGTAWFDLLEISPDPVINYQINADHTATAEISSNANNMMLRYAIDEIPTAQSPLYQQPIQIKKAATLYTALFAGEKAVAANQRFIPVNNALEKPVTFNSSYSEQYPASGAESLTDGKMGTTAFKDKNWMGFSAKDMNIVLDMQTASPVNMLTASFLCDPNSGIFLPALMEVFTSADGIKYSPAGKLKNTKGSVRGEPYLQQFSIPLKGKNVRYLKISAKSIGLIPEGYLFKGSPSWIFTDEVMVQ